MTGEVCPHHFILSTDDICEDDGNFKMNPPLRSRADVEALREALKNDVVDVIATDHAPHAEAEKNRSMKLAEKALEEMKAAAKTEKTENTQKKEETKNQSSESSKTTSSVKKENTGKTEKTESQVSSSAKKPASSSSSSAKKPASSAPSASSKPSNGGTTTLKNNGCEIDTSKAVAGTIRVRQNGNPTKVKVLVYFNGSSKYYQYTIPTNNTWTSIPPAVGKRYIQGAFHEAGERELLQPDVQCNVPGKGMQNANSAYLNPSQYVVYNSRVGLCGQGEEPCFRSRKRCAEGIEDLLLYCEQHFV